MSFHIGQKVVCVDAAPEPGTYWEVGARLYVRREYTIQAAGLITHCGNPGVLLSETRRVPGYCYWADRFRPAIEHKSSTKTGFSILDDIRKRETFDVPVPASDHQSN